jgi:hypothetical protein
MTGKNITSELPGGVTNTGKKYFILKKCLPLHGLLTKHKPLMLLK